MPSVRRSVRPCSSVSCQVRRRVSITRSAIMSIAVSRSRSSHSVPYGRRYRTVVTRGRRGDQLLAGGALRAQPPAGDRAVGVALDLGDPAVLDVDVLAAADRAVRADRLDHPVGGFGPRGQPLGGRGTGRGAPAGAVGAGELAVHRPPPQPLPEPQPSHHPARSGLRHLSHPGTRRCPRGPVQANWRPAAHTTTSGARCFPTTWQFSDRSTFHAIPSF